MQKLALLTACLAFGSLIAMDDGSRSPCSSWRAYLVKASQRAPLNRDDQAVMRQIMANMRREKCNTLRGKVCYDNAAAFRAAGARVTCPWQLYLLHATSWPIQDQEDTCTFTVEKKA